MPSLWVLAAILLIMILQSANPRVYPWAHYAAFAVVMITVLGVLARSRSTGGLLEALRNRRVVSSAISLPRILRISLLIWKLVLTLLATMTLVFSYLTAVAADSAKCIGRASILQYRNGIGGFWVPAIISILIVGAVLIRSKHVSRQTGELPASHGRIVFELGSIRITVSTLIAYAALVVHAAIVAMITEFAAVRYSAMVSYCR
jgi:hypothetical protein